MPAKDRESLALSRRGGLLLSKMTLFAAENATRIPRPRPVLWTFVKCNVNAVVTVHIGG
jgi:hypothetical protein